MARQDARSRDNDFDSLHERYPIFLCVAPDAQRTPVVQRTEDLPGAHVKRDIQELADTKTRTHADVRRGPADHYQSFG